MKTTPITTLALTALLAACLGACKSGKDEEPQIMPVESSPFGTTASGDEATLFTLTNTRGRVAKVTDFGATLVALQMPGRDGALADVVLGFDDVAGYESDANQYFGCTVGRVANRIAKGRFFLDGEDFELAVNNDPNHLHGGARGFGQRMWNAKPLEEGAAVRFTRASPDGEEGYPGRVSLSVTYTLTDEDELRIDYQAKTNAPTPINLTHHSYFNLAGAGSGTVLDHVLTIDAARYTPTDDTLIPTGELADVAGTPLDFTSPTRVGERLDALLDTPTLGYDHNYALDSEGGALARACRLEDPASGRVLEIWTTEPGLQLYTGNYLRGQAGKGGANYEQRGALCLETQHFPDSVHHANFPSTILRPGEAYKQTTVHRFSAE